MILTRALGEETLKPPYTVNATLPGIGKLN